ncbi:MAG: dTDP-4-dehydrorhamnose reductase [Gemmatimonadota bacterium]
MTRLLVTGAAGLLGTEVVAAAERRGYTVEPATRADLDVTDLDAVRAGLGDRPVERRLEAVLHCAAYTAVDGAEAEPELAARVNGDGTAHVARAAAEAGARLVHVSTDYVFDGERRTPYRPDDPPRPRSVYGRTKLAGERAALASAPSALVVRTSWLYGAGGRNFVTAMLERGRTDASPSPLRVVDDQLGRPTWARNVAEGMLDLLERRVRGVWHVADGGEATWLDLAREAYRLCGIDTALEPTTTEAWGAPAPRPAYSVLDLTGTEALLGRERMHWREALRRYLTETGDLEAS